jgi:hypothetical protein
LTKIDLNVSKFDSDLFSSVFIGGRLETGFWRIPATAQESFNH